MLSPTIDTIRNPDRLHRYLQEMVQSISDFQGQPLVGPLTFPPEERQLGPADLVPLGIDQSATARSATTDHAPTIGDDETAGYQRFSLWHHDAGGTQDVYICLNPIGGGAIWKKITP